MTLWTDELPEDMRLAPDTPTTIAVRGSGLTIACRHGDATCNRCIVAAARAIIDADTRSTP